MPVGRIPGTPRGRVYSSRAEISLWLDKGRAQTDLEPTPDSAKQGRSSNKYMFFGVALVIVLMGIASLITFRFRGDTLLARVSFTADSLRAFDADGRILWVHKFSGLLAPLSVNGRDLSDLDRTARIADLYGNGGREVVVVAPIRASPDPEEVAHLEVDCFSSSGRLIWSYSPTETFKFGSGEMNGPWVLYDLMISDTHAIYAAVLHAVWGNSFVVQLDPQSGRGIVRFVNTGSILRLHEFETSGSRYLLVGGFNNEFDGGSLAIVDERKRFAASPQTVGTRHRCLDCPPGDPDYYFVFPRSELNRHREVYLNNIGDLRVNGEEIEIRKRETDSKAWTYYILGAKPTYHVASMRFDSQYEMFHREMEQSGELDHSLAICPERLHPAAVRMWTRSNGWERLEVPPVSQ